MSFCHRLVYVVLVLCLISSVPLCNAQTSGPYIASITPASGTVGTQITITGQFLLPSGLQRSLAIGGQVATTTSWTDTQIVATIPSGLPGNTTSVPVYARYTDDWDIDISSNTYTWTILQPLITSLSPTSGVPGTVVTLTGSGFGASQGTSTVTFNGVTLTPATWSDTQITVPVPSGTAAAVGRFVVSVAGMSPSNSPYFAITPYIASITPSSGTVGTQITITGQFLLQGGLQHSLVIAGQAATTTGWTDTQIVATIPSGLPGNTTSVPITANYTDGWDINIASNTYNWTIQQPLITSLSPTSGVPGTVVTLTGSGFGASQGTSTVTLNGLTVTVTSWSDTKLGVTVPDGARTGPFVVSVPGMSASSSPYLSVLPFIASITPSSGGVGTQIEIQGDGLDFPGEHVLYVNGWPTEATSWTDTRIVATIRIGSIPATATSVPIWTVYYDSAGEEQITSSNTFDYAVSQASITQIMPSSGTPGTLVTINGSHFGATQQQSTVTFAGVPAQVSTWSDSQISVTIPEDATTGYMVVNVAGEGAGSSWYVIRPYIKSLSPAIGIQNTRATLTGKGLLPYGYDARTLLINGSPATVESWSDTEIVALLPSIAAEALSVDIKAAYEWCDSYEGYCTNTESNTVHYTIQQSAPPVPVLNSITPISGAPGTLVTISGTGFGALQGTSSTVQFNGALATPDSWSDTKIVVPVPNGAVTGNISLQIGGTSAQSPLFTVLSSLAISSINPTSGPVGTAVTITGSGFGVSQGTSTVSLNGVAATVASWSDTAISVIVPAGAPSGAFSVSVNGVSAESPVFTVTALPPGWFDQDVGIAGKVGSASYANGTFTVQGTGSLNPTTPDMFHFVYQTLTGDGTIVARVVSTTGQAGIMIRETMDAGSRSMYIDFRAGNPALLDVGARTVTGYTNSYNSWYTAPPYWLKLVRSGNNFTGYVSPDGVNWVQRDSSKTITMASTVYAGLIVSGSTRDSMIYGGTIDNVSISSAVQPAPAIISVSATTGSVGSQIVISGMNFGAAQGSSQVRLNGTPVTINSWSDTLIRITIPAGATSGYLAVSVAPSMNTSNPVTFAVTSQPLPSGWLDRDIGAVTMAGSASYSNGTFTVRGAGSLNPGSTDVFHFVHQALAGDGTIVARVVSITGQAGVMIRETMDPSSKSMFMFMASGSPPMLNTGSRTAAGAGNIYSGYSITFPYWLKLVRNGNNFTGYASSDGVNWVQKGSAQITMAGTVYAGLMVASNSTLYSGTFDNVSISSAVQPAPAITSVSATTGPVGSQAVVNGLNFGASQTGSLVVLNGAPVKVNLWSDTSIEITIPEGATSGYLTVVTAPGMNTSNPVIFAVTSQPLPWGWLDRDIGAVGKAGSASYVNGTFTVQGGGTFYESGAADAFHFVYQPLTGDGAIVARVTSATGGAGVVGRIGVMIRESMDTGSKNMFAGYNTSSSPGSTCFGISYRRVVGAGSSYDGYCYFAFPYWVKLVRSGDNFTAYRSPDGVSWTLVYGPLPVKMASSVYIGLAVGDSDSSVLYNATFDNVSVSAGAQPASVITSVSATTGSVGSQVTISGLNFGASQVGSVVLLNGAPVTIDSWSDTSIRIAIPEGATSGYLVVLTAPGMNSSSNPVMFTVTSQPLPSGWLDRDIGIVGKKGSATYADSVFTIQGAGNSVGGTADGFHFMYQPLTSDGVVIARVLSQSASSQVGVMIRETLDAGSEHVFSMLTPNYSAFTSSAKYRTLGGGGTSQSTYGSVPLPSWLKVVRSNGNAFSCYVFDRGAWYQVGSTQTFTTGQTVYVGIGVSSGNTQSLATATVDSISIAPGGSLPKPMVASVLPSTGTPGTSVVISGAGFGTSSSNNAVAFNGAIASISSWSDNQIVAVVPENAKTGPIAVTVGNITGQGPNFKVAFAAQVTDSLGNGTSYSSSLSGGQWSVTDIDGPGCSSCSTRGTSHNQYDGRGNVLWTTDALGRTKNYRYDSSNNLLSESVQLDDTTAATTSYTYNSLGQVLTVKDALGNTTTNAYDSKGNLLSITTPTSSVTKFAYDSKGQLTQITDPLGKITTLTYSPAGLVSSITDPNQSVTSYEYDARGNRTAVTDAMQNRTTFGFDAGNRLDSITYPDSTTTTFGYDSRGRRTSVTDQNSKTTTYAYDDADRLTSVTDAAGGITTYEYDTENNLLSITDAEQHVTSFGYDAFGRVKQTTFPSLFGESYDYDALGNLTSKTDRNGQTITYVYDALNRLTRKRYADSTTAEYVYDLVGKVKQVTDPTGTYAFAYDNMGRLVGTTTTYSFLPGKTISNSYTYDAASNRKTLTLNDGTVNYTYDSLNRLTGLTSSWAGSFGYGYDNLSRRTSFNRPNNISTSYDYDPQSRLMNVLHQFGGVTIDGATYDYDSAGNRKSKTNQIMHATDQYEYDSIYQLQQVASGEGVTESYTYDRVGNRLSNLAAAGWQYNASNQLTSTPTASFTYDSNGNMLTKTESGGQTSFAWDFENRLTAVTLPGDGGAVSFKYDPFGRRIWKSTSSGTTVYGYDGANIVAEYSGTGTLVAKYAQGAGIDEPLAMWRGGATSFYHADGLGSITSLTDASGSAVAAYQTDAFGKSIQSAGAVTNPFRYTGREWDQETSLYYYRARYYDPNIGRFISEDPIRFWAGVDFYKYVDNNPVSKTDPDGLLPGPSCAYYSYKCIKTSQQCRLDLDRASGNNELNLCQGTHSNNPDEAYFKSCFQENYYCQKMVESCGKGAVEPPFNKTNIGNGPPNNIGPKPDPPTPVQFPPNYPGKPLPNLY